MHRIPAFGAVELRGKCAILGLLGNLHKFALTEPGKMGYYYIIALHGGVVRRLTQGCADPSSWTRLSVILACGARGRRRVFADVRFRTL